MNKEKPHRIDSIGKKNPFVVPEGYFAQMQADVMNRLPYDGQEVAITVRHRFLRPFIAIAASVCIAVFGYAAYLQFASSENTVERAVVATADADQESNYIMMDNTSIYAYMSEY